MLDVIGARSIEDLLVGVPPRRGSPAPWPSPPRWPRPTSSAICATWLTRTPTPTAIACFLGRVAPTITTSPAPSTTSSRAASSSRRTRPISPRPARERLRTIFEYQTMIAELTGMDVANASIYDGASSLAEAALMAHAVTSRSEIVLAARGPSVLPARHRDLLRRDRTSACVTRPPPRACSTSTPRAAWSGRADGGAGHPVAELLRLPRGHSGGRPRSPTRPAPCSWWPSDPVNLGVLEAPGPLGADIWWARGRVWACRCATGDRISACSPRKQELVRRMPGRLVGATVDRDGARGFVLTLQTREQHIRRAKATSNICTNVALCALMATIYLALVGKRGLASVGELSASKAHYAAERASSQVRGCLPAFRGPVSSRSSSLRLPKSPERVVARLAQGSHPGRRAPEEFDRRPWRLPAGGGHREADARKRSTASRRRSPKAVGHEPAWRRRATTARLRAVLARAGGYSLPECDVPVADPLSQLLPAPHTCARRRPPCPRSPSSTSCATTHGCPASTTALDTHFYPLGSCTMKYNPRLNEDMARLPGFARLHPLAPAPAARGRSPSCTRWRRRWRRSPGWTRCPSSRRRAPKGSWLASS